MSDGKRLVRAISVALFAVAAVSILYYGKIILFSGMYGIRALFWCVIVIGMPLVFAMVLYAGASGDEKKNARMVKATLIILFLFYLVALAGTLFFSRIHPSTFRQDRAAYMARLDDMINLEPGRTIRRYIGTLRRGVITGVSLSNLAGNVLLFMPMAFFLPCLFPRMRSFWRFPLYMLILLLAVESMQLLLGCGACDVDDVILNLFGTLLMFAIVMLPPVKRLLIRLHLFQTDNAGGKGDAAE